MRIYILLTTFIILILLPLSNVNSQQVRTGLHFNSYLSVPEERTSLLLDDGDYLEIEDEITLSLDVCIREEKRMYGFILRMISNKAENIDLSISLKENKPYLSISSKNDIYTLAEDLQYDHWNPLSITLNRESNTITALYNGNKIEIPYIFDGNTLFIFSFGKCSVGDFKSDDVAPFNLKNITVSDGKKTIRQWNLDKYSNDICYDLLHGKIARASNPEWLINEHYQWTKVYEKIVPETFQTAFDAKNNVIYIVPDEKSIVKYNLATGKEETIDVKNGYPATKNYSQLIVDTLNNRLISFKIDEGRISVFSFEEQEWSLQKPVFPKSVFWHHSSIFNAEDTTILTFGGYGDYTYNNILATFDVNNDISYKTQIKDVYPRYSSSICLYNGYLYVFGGRGSESGKQELSTVYMYDLYKIDLSDKSVVKIGDYPIGEPFLPAENMIYREEDNSFYILTDAKGGSLMKLSLADSSITYIGSGLPIHMSSAHLYRNLVYSPSLGKLFAVFDTRADQGANINSLNVYSINYPPLTEEDILQPLPSGRSYTLIAILLTGFCGILLIIILYGKKIRKRDLASIQTEEDKQERQEQIIHEARSISKKEEKASITLLGRFCVKDKDGDDITNKFTPTLREMLLILILYTGYQNKGILNSKLDELLWPDKSKNPARNNRYVSIRKLRLLLSEIGYVEITGNNDYCKISFGEGVFCDYLELSYYMHSGQHYDNENETRKFLDILLSGPLLPNINMEWLDPFKSELSNNVVDCLDEIITKGIYNNNNKMMLQIADAILSHDILNEEAMQLKCRILFKEGKKGLAINTYEVFCKEYEILLDTKYPLSFNEIITG